jgi:hypothetical protein
MDPYDDSIERHVFDAIEYNPEELRRLLEDGLDPNIRDELDESALTIASIRGYEDIVRLFLEYNADPNIVNEFYETPLSQASIYGHVDTVKTLLEYNADPNIYDDVKYTPLMRAISHRFVEIVRLLLDNGADPFFINIRGDTALDLAERYPNYTIIDLLKSRMATIRTQRAKQHLSTSRLPIADDLTEMISERLGRMLYHPAITQRMIQEEENIEQLKRKKKRTQKKKRKQKKKKKKKKLY